MIRSVGPAGPVKVLWLLCLRLRWDLLALVVVMGAMSFLADRLSTQGTAAVIPGMSVVVSIFIGFRNNSAYSRWWEARTLWGNVIGNSRALSNALIAFDSGVADISATLDRMRRRQVRYVWQLAAELRRVPTVSGVAELTPEDPAETRSVQLLSRQAEDIRLLAQADCINPQGNSMLTGIINAQGSVAGGLERIRNQSLPSHYAGFVRALAWFFGVMVCAQLTAARHDALIGMVLGFAAMGMFVLAERLGHIIEEPMNNTATDLPMYRFCARITAELLGKDHPLAQPRESEAATVWM